VTKTVYTVVPLFSNNEQVADLEVLNGDDSLIEDLNYAFSRESIKSSCIMALLGRYFLTRNRDIANSRHKSGSNFREM
jgi:hypothetical protein